MPTPPDAFVSAEFRELHSVDLNFNCEWRLAGLKFLEDGQRFMLALRWQCLQRVSNWLQCFAHVLDGAGNQIGSLDHDLLHGYPAPAEWRPGDEGFEVRYLDLSRTGLRKTRIFLGESGYEISSDGCVDEVFQLRLGLFDPNTNLRLPLAAATVPVVDDYTAALIEANAVPGTEYAFRLMPAPVSRCRVNFEEGVTLEGYSMTRGGPALWVRLRWAVSGRPKKPLRFFGHAVPARDPEVAALASFDQEMGLERRGPSPQFEQDIVRALPAGQPGARFLRAGVCTSTELARLPIRESSFEWNTAARCIYIPIPLQKYWSSNGEYLL